MARYYVIKTDDGRYSLFQEGYKTSISSVFDISYPFGDFFGHIYAFWVNNTYRLFLNTDGYYCQEIASEDFMYFFPNILFVNLGKQEQRWYLIVPEDRFELVGEKLSKTAPVFCRSKDSIFPDKLTFVSSKTDEKGNITPLVEQHYCSEFIVRSDDSISYEDVHCSNGVSRYFVNGRYYQ